MHWWICRRRNVKPRNLKGRKRRKGKSRPKIKLNLKKRVEEEAVKLTLFGRGT